MANTWLAKSTPLAAPNSPEGFGIIHACEGVYEGECLFTAVFCIFLWMVLDTSIVNCNNAGIQNAEKAITIMAYVDDVVLVFQQDLYGNTLKQFNLVVEKSKCKAWIPDDSTPHPSIQAAESTDGISVVT